MSRVLIVALWLGVLGCGGSHVTNEHPTADVTKSLPATLEATHPKTGDPRPLHVLVYADPGTRALPKWREEITDQLDYAGQLLSPLLGVRLTIDAIKEWDHAGSDPRESVKALAVLESKPDDDTVWVIGYIAPAETAQKALDELGSSELLGRYVAVRTWSEKPETEALTASLPDLNDAQRSEVITAHKRHKQTVILLHQLAKSLGAIDEADPSWLGHPLYSAKQTTFSERDRDLMQLAIDARLGGATKPAIAHDLLEAIAKSEWGGWIPNDKEAVTQTLRNIIDATKTGKTVADVPPAAYEQFDRARELAKRGDFGQALHELENVMSAYPGNSTMQETKCEILIAKPLHAAPPPKLPAPVAAPDHLGITEKATRQACARVTELAPGDPSPHLAVGEALAHLPKPDLAGARAELVLAAAKITNKKTGQPEAWQQLVTIYAAMGALTWTEEALAQSKLENNPIAKETAQLRVRYGIAKNTKVVKPELEGALLAATRDASAMIGTGKLAESERTLATAERRWPTAPGLAAMRCDLAFRQSQLDTARAACNRALAVDPDESWALYLGGVLALKDTSASGTRAGVDKLEHAISVDPELGQAWRALGKAYDRAKDQKAHDALAARYQAKFGQALP
ncbi:hypothetical protein BH11MYX1_BH11MYX1_15730 [soil metagenome]